MVIRNRADLSYYHDGAWTPHHHQATRFAKLDELFAHAQRAQLKDCELVMMTGGEPSAHDVCVPLNCATSEPSWRPPIALQISPGTDPSPARG